MEKKSNIEKNNEFLYHNTELLLKKYRDVVWSIEVSAMQAEVNFEFETGCKMTEFLDMSYAAGADLMNTKIEEQVRTMERNRKMLQLIDRAVDIIRRKHQKGEMMYWVLYYTYLCEKPLESVEEIVDKIAQKQYYVSWQTYFNYRRQAINLLSTMLWGYTSKECMEITKTLVKPEGV